MSNRAPNSWRLGEPVEFEAPGSFPSDLASLFDLDSAITAIAFFWRSGGTDGKESFGNHGWIEHWRQDGMSKSETAVNNQSYAAMAWAFDDQYQNLCYGLCRARNGNSSMLIALRNGRLFSFDDAVLYDEPTNALINDDDLSITDDGVLRGIRPAFINGTRTAHDQLDASEVFRTHFSDIAIAADVILALRSAKQADEAE